MNFKVFETCIHIARKLDGNPIWEKFHILDVFHIIVGKTSFHISFYFVMSQRLYNFIWQSYPIWVYGWKTFNKIFFLKNLFVQFFLSTGNPVGDNKLFQSI